MAAGVLWLAKKFRQATQRWQNLAHAAAEAVDSLNTAPDMV